MHRSEINLDDESVQADGLASLLIGVTFVVFFAAMSVGLVLHTVIFRAVTSKQNNNNNLDKGGMRSPKDEDGTPPELRSQPTFVQPLDQQDQRGVAKINHSGKAVSCVSACFRVVQRGHP